MKRKKFLKKITLLLLINTLSTIYAYAQTKYVSDDLSTFLLKGPNNTFKIVGKINAGEAVEVLSQNANYTLVKTSNNRQGWILTSELSDAKDKDTRVMQLNQKVQDLEIKLKNINSEWGNKTSNSSSFIKELEEKNKDFLEKNNALDSEIKKLKAENDTLQLHTDKDKQAIAIKYFAYGGTAVVIGLVLGLLLPNMIPARNKDKWKY